MIGFQQIPQTLRTPGFFAEVDPTKANTGAQNLKSLLIGQLTNGGSRCVAVQTSASSSSGASILTFASGAVVASVVKGMVAIDRTATTAIGAGVTVLSVAGAVVTLASPLAGNVGSADHIEFYDLTPALLTSQTDASGKFGVGSQLARMYRVYRKNDPLGECWALSLPDDPQATAATGTVVVSGTATQAGVISLYVSGKRIPVAVTTVMSATQIASAIASAVNGDTTLPVTAGASSGTVTLTARNAGSAGADLDVRLNYGGVPAGEVTPPGLTIVLTAMAVSSVNPSAQLVVQLAALPPQLWGFVASAYSDTTSLDALKSFMDDITGQWAWLQMRYGAVFYSKRASLGSLQSFGVGRNDPHASDMGVYDSPSSPEEWAADYTAGYARMQRAQPGGSANGVVLASVKPPPVQSRFAPLDRNTLLWSGVSTFSVDPDGTVRIEKAITTYQVDRFGNADDSELQLDTMFRLAFCLLYMKSKIDGKYAGARLADDGTRFGPGLNVVTPAIIKSELISLYTDLINLGMVFDLSGFSDGLIVERNQTNRGRVDVLWPGAMASDLDIIALLAQFHQ